MATDGGGGGGASPPAAKKKANLLDPYSIKHLLDDTVSDVVKSKGYTEDTRLSNRKLVLGAAVIAVALLAQFYRVKFPQNRDVLLVCIAIFVVLNVVQQIVSYTKEKNAILFAHPPAGSFNRTGLVISSKLPTLSDMYTLAIANAGPLSKSSSEPVHFTKSVTKWFSKDGVLVEGLFWKDVEKLIDDYNSEHRSK
uniref:Signal peptidase complex subunit 2 n=1 Tax=Leersia perrieri TaxID=77586 RepID=A0A0D9VHA2_9ORYZ